MRILHRVKNSWSARGNSERGMHCIKVGMQRKAEHTKKADNTKERAAQRHI